MRARVSRPDGPPVVSVVLTDSHCHLDEFDDAAAVLDAAAAVAVEAVVAVAQDLSSMRAVVALKARFPQAVKAAVGLHPTRVVDQSPAQTEEALDFLAAQLPEADELGEVGLDFKWADTPELQQRQRDVLERQLEMAARWRKPANLHSRRSQRQVMELAVAFHRETGLNAQLHWFTQSRKLVHVCNDEGIYVSVGPSVIDDDQAQRTALTVADELLLLETDAPVAVGGLAGTPARVRQVAEKLGDLKGVSWEEVAAQTQHNLERFLAAP